MTKPTFHIVSDGSCDLPLPETEKLGVIPSGFLSLSTENTTRRKDWKSRWRISIRRWWTSLELIP